MNLIFTFFNISKQWIYLQCVVPIYAKALAYIYVVVQFYPWFKFSLLSFQSHYHVIIIHYHTQKQKKRKFEPTIKLNHNIYNCPCVDLFLLDHCVINVVYVCLSCLKVTGQYATWRCAHSRKIFFFHCQQKLSDCLVFKFFLRNALTSQTL